MSIERLYYQIKPFIPRGTRMALRRGHARRVLKRGSAATWPINEAAGGEPQGWEGWPEDKEFAFVLTHDVESQSGYDKVRHLAKLEMEFGFRSSFNFVPEGGYRVGEELRTWLADHGFEVGVHDLKHDGKLYASREKFRRNAKRINQYLEEWGSCGFRSGFMLRELDWLHDLDISYDASTFDGDPFEPQPDGSNTIFPFMVTNSAGDCYVELPYTLVQDSTLFLVLEKTDTEIWRHKLDWIVAKGGLGLLNIHPDYVDFSGRGRRNYTYPVEYLRDFFTHLKERFADRYWHPLPKELAGWYRDSHIGGTATAPTEATITDAARKTPTTDIQAALSGKRAAVVLYSVYPEDPRPRRAAEALAEAGMSVDMICLREDKAKPRREEIDGVNVRRLRIPKSRKSKIGYFFQYGTFIFACFWILALRTLRRRYHLVHAHNMPDILAYSGLVPKLAGAKVILDLHDPMPELMQCIYHHPEDSRMVRWLKRLERRSIKFSHLVLTPNRAFKELFVSRGCPDDKIQIVMNSPKGEIFARPAVPLEKRPAFRVMHHGFIAERHGLDTALRAIAELKDSIPEIEFHVYGGETPYVAEMDKLVEELGLNGTYHYHGFKTLPEIADAICEADLGVVPNRRSPFTEINMPTRILEYMAMGKPVVVPDTKGIRDYCDDDSVLFFDPDQPATLAAAILRAYEDPEHTAALVARGREVYEGHRWGAEKHAFLRGVSNLLS